MTKRNRQLGRCLISSALAMILASVAPIAAFGQSTGAIKLAEGDWTGNLLQVHLAKIILEENMGYEVDLIFADYTAQWVSIASGDLHIAMEQWQESTLPQMEKFLSEYGGNGEITFLGRHRRNRRNRLLCADLRDRRRSGSRYRSPVSAIEGLASAQ